MHYDETGDGLHVLSYTKMIWAAIASVGWYIVGISIGLWYFSPYIKEKYANWKRKHDDDEYAAKYHKNPDLLQERLSALEVSRQRMQERYRQQTLLAEQKKEELKKQKQEAAWTLEGTKSLKGEYNPLMGDGSRGYRPPKRSCCSKGGCG